jgi:hypothetical protein
VGKAALRLSTESDHGVCARDEKQKSASHFLLSQRPKPMELSGTHFSFDAVLSI